MTEHGNPHTKGLLLVGNEENPFPEMVTIAPPKIELSPEVAVNVLSVRFT